MIHLGRGPSFTLVCISGISYSEFRVFSFHCFKRQPKLMFFFFHPRLQWRNLKWWTVRKQSPEYSIFNPLFTILLLKLKLCWAFHTFLRGPIWNGHSRWKVDLAGVDQPGKLFLFLRSSLIRNIVTNYWWFFFVVWNLSIGCKAVKVKRQKHMVALSPSLFGNSKKPTQDGTEYPWTIFIGLHFSQNSASVLFFL